MDYSNSKRIVNRVRARAAFEDSSKDKLALVLVNKLSEGGACNCYLDVGFNFVLYRTVARSKMKLTIVTGRGEERTDLRVLL